MAGELGDSPSPVRASAQELREAITVLDEEFHRESVSRVLAEAADRLEFLEAQVRTREQHISQLIEEKSAEARGRQQAEQARDDLPHLTWESPDADGDHIVWLKGVPHWHLVHHGDTPLVALVGLAEGIVVAANMDKPSRVELKEQVAALTQALKDVAAHDGDRWSYETDMPEPKPSPQEIAQSALAALTGAQASLPAPPAEEKA